MTVQRDLWALALVFAMWFSTGCSTFTQMAKGGMAAFNEQPSMEVSLDRLDGIATQAGVSLITLVLGWTVSQPGITAVLCGAKRPWQIQESAAAVNWTPTAEVLKAINEAILERNSLGRTS